MIRVVDDEKGIIEVGNSPLFGQTIYARRHADGETRFLPLIESREEYDFEMKRAMEWLGLIEGVVDDS